MSFRLRVSRTRKGLSYRRRGAMAAVGDMKNGAAHWCFQVSVSSYKQGRCQSADGVDSRQG
ncbi:protein of unknown function (plasmid) [Cupriavidus taiwanensis]|uniref:Uncharacterized protein n=1 Tax=Cupriavidus taiwanensis TaxID=164546 RepID=A0A375I6Z1_9BURK|nr:hypothetical protein CT19425_U600058 [Cupriavidus taiwanensis]SPK77061.1 protein of unknown function [Cupriavidus taiwanensis]SPS00052.1 hypothetical protein CBM2634_B140064 [Cupriavidus taiwanensis]